MTGSVRIIGITGGIGAGKSVVSRILRCMGFEVYDCDLEARRIMDSSCELKDMIRLRFGESCVDRSGQLIRAEIARIIFSDKQSRQWLNSQVHSMVCSDVLACAARKGDGLLFVESAIMRTSGLVDLCDAMILVDAPVETRIRRVSRRDNADEEAIGKRIEAQAGEYEDFGDTPLFRISNGEKDALMPQIDCILRFLR